MYISGLIWNTTENPLYTTTRYKYNNQTWEEYWDILRNLMTFYGPIKIHIPKPYWNISNFRSTLGHKVNHSFKYATTIFGWVFHPRFGNIRSIVAIQDIAKGEEVLVNYGYSQNNHAPKWYINLYKEETGKEWNVQKFRDVDEQVKTRKCGRGK